MQNNRPFFMEQHPQNSSSSTKRSASSSSSSSSEKNSSSTTETSDLVITRENEEILYSHFKDTYSDLSILTMNGCSISSLPLLPEKLILINIYNCSNLTYIHANTIPKSVTFLETVRCPKLSKLDIKDSNIDTLHLEGITIPTLDQFPDSLKILSITKSDDNRANIRQHNNIITHIKNIKNLPDGLNELEIIGLNVWIDRFPENVSKLTLTGSQYEQNVQQLFKMQRTKKDKKTFLKKVNDYLAISGNFANASPLSSSSEEEEPIMFYEDRGPNKKRPLQDTGIKIKKTRAKKHAEAVAEAEEIPLVTHVSPVSEEGYDYYLDENGNRVNVPLMTEGVGERINTKPYSAGRKKQNYKTKTNKRIKKNKTKTNKRRNA